MSETHKKIELREALVWTCDCCQKTVVIDVASNSVEMDAAEGFSGLVFEVPNTVICPDCLSIYNVDTAKYDADFDGSVPWD